MNDQIRANIMLLLSYLGIMAEQVDIVEDDNSISINLLIPESDAGIFIGHYAETLESIQRIISAIINNGRDTHLPVMVDIAGYRQKRYSKLESMATRLCDEVRDTKSRRSFPLGLSATERRQIHLLFTDNEEFITYSEGEGANRRLYLDLRSE